jgi:hypothetical protein
MIHNVFMITSFNFQEKKVENSLVSEMLKDNLRLIWDHFLCCEHFFEAAKI